MTLRHYHNQQRLPYEASFLFDIAADAASYPQFVPWCEGVRIVSAQEHSHVALVRFGYGQLSYEFHSYNQWRVPNDGNAAYVVEARSDEKPFRHLYSRWNLTPIRQPIGQETQVDFYTEYELHSVIIDALLRQLWDDVSGRMIAAFAQRAKDLSQ